MFDSSVKYYWTATHSQIYRTLDEMKKEGLIEEELIVQHGVPNKKVYSITNKGQDELYTWMEKPADLPPVRHALLVQLSWADRLKTEQIIELLEGYRRKIEERVAVYGDQNQAQFLSLSRTPREKVLWESILENGITSYQAELDWVRRTINKLEKFE